VAYSPWPPLCEGIRQLWTSGLCATPWWSIRDVRWMVKWRLQGVRTKSIPLPLELRTLKLYHHHHHHVPEGLGVFPVPWSPRWSWSLHLFLGLPMFFRPFGLYCSACFGSLFASILCTSCSHFSWYCFISFTMFCVPVFCLMHWLKLFQLQNS
jgi:hypothetical protein